MIKVTLDEINSIAIIQPETMQGLSETDFKELTNLIDSYLETHETLNGLIIIAENFPGWEDFKAFSSHLKFVKDHHKAIKKVALVSNSSLMNFAPKIVDHFVNAQARAFKLDDLEQAKVWAISKDMKQGEFIVLDGYPENVIALKATGFITSEDYEKTLIPLTTQKIKEHGKVKLLYWCGDEFEGFSAGAMWDDTSFGLTHLGDFLKIAFVTDIDWMRYSVMIFAPLIKADVKIYKNAEIEDANRWIKEKNDTKNSDGSDNS